MSTTKTKKILLKIRLHLKEALPKDFIPVIPAMRSTSALWNMSKPIQAVQNVEGEDKYWQVSAFIPKSSEFEWRWAIYNEKGLVNIEREYRRCKLGKFGGVLHTSWDTEAKIMEPDMCVVDFYTRYRALPDETLAILGSSEALGGWCPSKAVPAYEYPTGSGEWSVTVPQERNVYQEWKWVVMDVNRYYVRRWEDRPNRVLNCEYYSWMVIWAPWCGGDYVTDSGCWENSEWSALRLPTQLDCECELFKSNINDADHDCSLKQDASKL